MTEEHFNNGKTLLDNRNRIAGIKTLLQGEGKEEYGNISIIDQLKLTDTKTYVQILDFAKELLAKEEARLQEAFDALTE